MARSLVLYQEYTRQDVHDIFDPASIFTRGAGSWGMQGIIPIPGRPNDFVLFVSYGRSQGEHTFDEGISADGIFRWQSQPQQILQTPQIKQFIAHDEAANSIYLFLRTTIRHDGQQRPYTYLGRLKYRGHDNTREQPVYFVWQLLDWPMPRAVREKMALHLDDGQAEPPLSQMGGVEMSPGTLVEEEPPKQQAANPEATRQFRGVQRRYPSDAENRALGALGEKLVLEQEKSTLRSAGRADLADGVRHTAAEEGDGAGYDIASYFIDGRIKYIEVKTTSGPKTTDFFLSANEVAFSRAHAASYELRRVFDYDKETGCAKCFSLFGSISDSLNLLPTTFRASRLIDK